MKEGLSARINEEVRYSKYDYSLQGAGNIRLKDADQKG
jgi:hypothetical protein